MKKVLSAALALMLTGSLLSSQALQSTDLHIKGDINSDSNTDLSDLTLLSLNLLGDFSFSPEQYVTSDINYDKDVDIAYVTLHVGLGTFRPVKVDDVTNHHMHTEFYQVTKEAADKINKAKSSGNRVICVGTTSCRTIESAASADGTLKECSGDTDIFIYPGYKFKVLDCLITNFHLPESTLVMLVSALAGKESVLDAYKVAVDEKYRFFSFGDAMFITDDDKL